MQKQIQIYFLLFEMKREDLHKPGSNTVQESRLQQP
jgi:hypothetical protein